MLSGSHLQPHTNSCGGNYAVAEFTELQRRRESATVWGLALGRDSAGTAATGLPLSGLRLDFTETISAQLKKPLHEIYRPGFSQQTEAGEHSGNVRLKEIRRIRRMISHWSKVGDTRVPVGGFEYAWRVRNTDACVSGNHTVVCDQGLARRCRIDKWKAAVNQIGGPEDQRVRWCVYNLAIIELIHLLLNILVHFDIFSRHQGAAAAPNGPRR